MELKVCGGPGGRGCMVSVVAYVGDSTDSNETKAHGRTVFFGVPTSFSISLDRRTLKRVCEEEGMPSHPTRQQPTASTTDLW